MKQWNWQKYTKNIGFFIKSLLNKQRPTIWYGFNWILIKKMSINEWLTHKLISFTIQWLQNELKHLIVREKVCKRWLHDTAMILFSFIRREVDPLHLPKKSSEDVFFFYSYIYRSHKVHYLQIWKLLVRVCSCTNKRRQFGNFFDEIHTFQVSKNRIEIWNNKTKTDLPSRLQSKMETFDRKIFLSSPQPPKYPLNWNRLFQKLCSIIFNI